MPLRRSGPQLFKVLFLDLLVTAIVVSAALVALLPDLQVAKFKARFIDVLYAMATERATLIERHAYAGAWTETAAIGNQEGAPSAPQRGYQVRTADGSVVAAGTLSGRRFVASMRPAVADSVSQWSVLWLCGARQPPAGWTTARGAAQFDLPEELVLSVCRAEKKS